MTRILSYNILVGGAKRIDQIARIISSAQPDVVGLVEATNPNVVKELAERLEMKYILSGNPTHSHDWHVAVLSRLPVVRTEVHTRPDVLIKPVLEVGLEEPGGRQLTVFVAHLSAAFNQGWAGNHIRKREVAELLRVMATKQGTAHVLMGDFNALAPGDRLQASILLRYLVEMDQRIEQHPEQHDGYPYLNFVVPSFLRIFNPILRLIPRSDLLSALFDEAGSIYAPRGSIGLIRKAGYVDCFRRLHPDTLGFTCPASAPAGRIDYIFASPEMAQRLSSCEVVSEADGVRGDEASDHLAVVAEFGESVGNDVEEHNNKEDDQDVGAQYIAPLH